MARPSIGSLFAMTLAAWLAVGGCSPRKPDTTQTRSEPTATDAEEPESIAGPAVDVAVGIESACAVAGTGDAAGRVWCWPTSPLDDSSRTEADPWAPPTVVAGLPSVSDVEGGYYEWCAHSTTGDVWCWEDPLYYKTDTEVPTRIELPGPVTDLALGPDGGCALVAGDPWCWERRSGMRPSTRDLPERRDLGADATSVDLGRGHACAALVDRSTRCWGSNSWGQLGDGNGSHMTDSSEEPVTPVGLGPTDSVALGYSSSCALLTDGSVSCWGSHPSIEPLPSTARPGPLVNRSPTYDYSSPVEARTPMQVAGIHGATSISSSDDTLCVIGVDETAACWGDDAAGRLGRGSPPVGHTNTVRSPVGIAGLSDVTALDVGLLTVCAVDRLGRISCWGTYARDEIGSPLYVLDPVRVEAFG